MRAQKASTRETQSGQARPSLSLLSSFSPCIFPVPSQAVHTLILQECKADKEHTAFLSLSFSEQLSPCWSHTEAAPQALTGAVPLPEVSRIAS